MKVLLTSLGAIAIILSFLHLIFIVRNIKLNYNNKDLYITWVALIAMFGSAFVITRDNLGKNMIISIILITMWGLYFILALIDIFIKLKKQLKYKNKKHDVPSGLHHS